MFKHLLKNRLFAGATISVVISLILSALLSFNAFSNLHDNFANNLYTLDEPSEDIVIIAIDDRSTQPAPEGLGRFSNWTRQNYTEMLAALAPEEPRTLTFDIIFHTHTTIVSKALLTDFFDEMDSIDSGSEKIEAYENFFEENTSSLQDPVDNQYALALQETPNVILGALIGDNGELIEPLYKFRVNATVGLVNSVLDDSGILKFTTPTFDFGEEKYSSLSAATVERALGQLPDIPTEDGKMLVNFFGDPFSYKMVSFVDVVNGRFEPGTFRNKIVLIGATSSKEVHDEFYTPRSNVTPMPGVEFHANAIQTILEGKFLHNQSKLGTIATVLLLATLAATAFNYLGATLSILLALALLLGYYLAAHFFYGRGLILNMVYPFLAILLAYLGSWVYKYFVADKNKRHLKTAFSHYVSPSLVEEISKNPEMVKLGGEKKEITVLFSDIQNSTAHSEKVEISAWVSQMNEYFTVMESIIKNNGGTIDKYEGDAVMCFWNAPLAQENHTALAYKTAQEMHQALTQLHAKWQQEGRPLLKFRIGINTGSAIVGNFGSATRFDYTATGDTVNTASRLESSVNKAYGTTLAIANPPANLTLREIDTVLVPGKSEPLKIYDLADSETTKTYVQGLSAYHQKDFASAIAAFQSLPNDPAAQTLLVRCQKLQSGEQLPQLDLQTMVWKILEK